jgi:hypothetical protein
MHTHAHARTNIHTHTPTHTPTHPLIHPRMPAGPSACARMHACVRPHGHPLHTHTQTCRLSVSLYLPPSPFPRSLSPPLSPCVSLLPTTLSPSDHPPRKRHSVPPPMDVDIHMGQGQMCREQVTRYTRTVKRRQPTFAGDELAVRGGVRKLCTGLK